MNTDDLVRHLAADTRPVARNSVTRRLVAGMAVGGAGSAMIILIALGFRPDLGTAMRGASFWMKWGYTFSLAVAALVMTAQLARPDSGRLRGLWLLAMPVILLAGVGLLELVHTPSSQWLAMWLGQSWQSCPWLVLSLSAPIFAGLLWSFRRLAPTRLRAAGATAGLSAGAFAATVYCLHCPEVSAIFVLTWYSLGIVLATLLGTVVGPRLLRW
ncbi:DUF1109 domain-containing protein [Sphingobium olei]|uniref:DUF1109 domain-containing protein n=1 Tax=Sphingobium olei TaxID=420955 RepID=A0ABW3P5Z0_9SPHN|nr:DUF1109 domain-containing protein [Sphingobium sp.]